MFGMIPYCVENPALHVQRRVSVWRAVLPAGEPGDVYSWVKDDLATLRRHSNSISYHHTCIAFKVWIEGAVALSASGMPAKS